MGFFVVADFVARRFGGNSIELGLDVLFDAPAFLSRHFVADCVACPLAGAKSPVFRRVIGVLARTTALGRVTCVTLKMGNVPDLYLGLDESFGVKNGPCPDTDRLPRATRWPRLPSPDLAALFP